MARGWGKQKPLPRIQHRKPTSLGQERELFTAVRLTSHKQSTPFDQSCTLNVSGDEEVARYASRKINEQHPLAKCTEFEEWFTYSHWWVRWGNTDCQRVYPRGPNRVALRKVWVEAVKARLFEDQEYKAGVAWGQPRPCLQLSHNFLQAVWRPNSRQLIEICTLT